MQRFAVLGALIVVALTTASCGAGRRDPDAGPGPLVLVRVCGPFTATGRPLRKGCDLQRISQAVLFPGAVEHRPWHAPGSTTASAQLTGVVEVCGDPFPQPPRPPAQDSCTLQEGHVHVIDALGRVVAQARLVDGRFTFAMAAGRYRLIAWNDGNGPFKESVDLAARQTTVADIVVPAI